MKYLVTAGALALGAATPAHSSVIQNGFFDEGLTGWTARAETNFNGSVDSATYINVQQNNGNSYARLLTDADADSFVTFVSLTQEFHLTLSAPVLSFDFGLILDRGNPDNPPSLNEVSSSKDDFRAVITDLNAAGTIFDPGRYILVDRTSTAAPDNPSERTVTDNSVGTDGTGVSLALTTRDASDPLFDTTVAVDLTNLVGRDLSLQFVIRDFFDGRQTAYAVDNIALSAAEIRGPAVTPLPGSTWLLAAGLGALAIVRCKRES